MTQKNPILTLNAGSSSLKFAVFKTAVSGGEPVEILNGQISGIGSNSSFTSRIKGEKSQTSIFEGKAVATHKEALEKVFDYLNAQQLPLSGFIGAGHRIVHGGIRFVSPVRVDQRVFAELKALEPLAPHHMPHNLTAIRSLAEIVPELPQIGCFDTAFHAGRGEIETREAIPEKWFGKGIRRYGFHGLNYEHVVNALPGLISGPLPSRLIILHLGNGASICAVKEGVCAATTMGFSTIDGLIMGTRSGAIDPGVLLHLLKIEGFGVEQLEDMLYNRSGLLGLSGISGDMRDLLKEGSKPARFAIDKFCRSAARHTGSLIPALGGLDGLVFTGGVGENAAPVRAQITTYLECFGVHLDHKANAADQSALAKPDSRVSIWIVPADEESTIARQTFALI